MPVYLQVYGSALASLVLMIPTVPTVSILVAKLVVASNTRVVGVVLNVLYRRRAALLAMGLRPVAPIMDRTLTLMNRY